MTRAMTVRRSLPADGLTLTGCAPTVLGCCAAAALGPTLTHPSDPVSSAQSWQNRLVSRLRDH